MVSKLSKDKISKFVQDYRKKLNPMTLEDISNNIDDRMRILENVNSEIDELSKDLFYYNMLDHLGEIKNDSLNLKQIISLILELNIAKCKLSGKYLKKCEEIQSKLYLTGYEKSKIILTTFQTDDFSTFFQISDANTKSKLMAYYFKKKKERLGNIIKECSNNLERSYGLFIHGELRSFIGYFGNTLNMEYDFKIPEMSILDPFDAYLFDIFSLILNKNNLEIAGRIRSEIYKQSIEEQNLEDKIFILMLKVYNNKKFKPNMSLKSQKCIEI